MLVLYMRHHYYCICNRPSNRNISLGFKFYPKSIAYYYLMVEPTSNEALPEEDKPEEDKIMPKSRSKRDSYNHTFDEQRRQFLYEVIIGHSKIKDVTLLAGS